MKKQGVLNQPISQVIAGMGHGDMLVIGDCGLPIPPGVLRIDLALTAGVPGFMQTLTTILEELQVEEAIIAQEMKEVSPALEEEVVRQMGTTPLGRMSHESFKEMTKRAVAVVRTGECTPYANIILKSGVVF
jgi:D-ribose pyranase